MGLLTLFPGWAKVMRSNLSNVLAHPNSANHAKLLRGDGTWVAQPTTYKTTVAGGSVPATSTAAGDWYWISSAGTSQGKTWAPLDMAVYEGSSGNWSQIPFATVGPLISPFVAARQGADYLYSDGATPNRRIETQYGAAGAVAGSDLTVVQTLVVPTANPSARACLWALSSVNTSDPAAAAWSLGVYLETNGDLTILQNGATPATDYRKVTHANWRTTYSGRRITRVDTFGGNATAAPVSYQEAVVLAGGVATDGAGTDPAWMSSSLVSTYFLQMYNWPAGYFRPGAPVNRKYTQADVDFVQIAGRLPYPDAAGGSMVATYTSNFAAGTDSWAADNATLVGNLDGIGGDNDWLEVTATSAAIIGVYRDNALLARRASYCTVKVYNPVGSGFTHFAHRGRGTGGLSQNVTAIPEGTSATIAGMIVEGDPTGTWSYAVSPVNSAGTLITATVGAKFYVKSVLTRVVGALSVPIIQPIPVLADASGNGKASLLVGFVPVTQRKDWMIQAQTSTNGNQQILGAAVLDASNKHRIVDWVVANAGTSKTVSLGNASGGAQYLSAGTAGAGVTDVTLATRIAATTALWVASNGTDVLTHTITGHRID